MLYNFLALLAGLALLGGGYFYFSAAPKATTDSYAAVASAQATSTGDWVPAATTPTTSTPADVTEAQPISDTNQQHVMSATLHTNQGDITIEFLPDLSPTAVASFTKLATSGFYDGTKFHRVIKGFMIQGGDPLSKDASQEARWGTGGPGYTFNDEIAAGSVNDVGMVAMANSGPNTNGSQFYINTANNSFLNGKYTVFGKVTAGMDVVRTIEGTPTDSSDRPLTPMVINSITLK